MAFGTAQDARSGEAWDALAALAAMEGSGREPWALALASSSATTRDLADAVHCWCSLHARYPGVLDLIQARSRGRIADAWLTQAAVGFSQERDELVRLMVAAGPLPSTPGQAQTDMAITAQRHALDMLAASDRAGCPIGAAAALILDWGAARAVFVTAADRLGIDLPTLALPAPADSRAAILSLAENTAFDRAALFGASQVLAQHRALWQLLQARAEARVLS